VKRAPGIFPGIIITTTGTTITIGAITITGATTTTTIIITIGVIIITGANPGQ
jgi:hypothetical protein